MNPIISVIIPAYNAANHIEATINSVQAQTYTNWEVWVVDDESSDGTYAMVQEIQAQDPRIHLIRQKNTGQGGARNTGIQNSQGEWIALLDADDIWMPEKLEKQIQVVAQDPEIDLVYTGWRNFSDQEDTSTQEYSWKPGKHTGKSLFRALFTENGIPNSSLLIRKAAVETLNYYDEADTLRGTEDWDLLLRAAKNGCTFFGIPQALLAYRIHEGGIHLNNVRMLEGKMAVVRKYDEDPEIPLLEESSELSDILPGAYEPICPAFKL